METEQDLIDGIRRDLREARTNIAYGYASVKNAQNTAQHIRDAESKLTRLEVEIARLAEIEKRAEAELAKRQEVV